MVLTRDSPTQLRLWLRSESSRYSTPRVLFSWNIFRLESSIRAYPQLTVQCELVWSANPNLDTSISNIYFWPLWSLQFRTNTWFSHHSAVFVNFVCLSICFSRIDINYRYCPLKCLCVYFKLLRSKSAKWFHVACRHTVDPSDSIRYIQPMSSECQLFAQDE